MKDPSIIWRRTFPDSAPRTDGVAIFEGRVIGRVRLLADVPRDPKPWSWSITDPEFAGRPGWADTHGEIALAPAGHGSLDRALARAAGLLRIAARCPGASPEARRAGRELSQHEG